MKSLLIILLLFVASFISAQTTDTLNATQVGAKARAQQLHVLVTRNKFTILDSTYTFNTSDINAIYELIDRQKAIEKFGEQGKYGALIISAKQRDLSKFLKSMGIVYPLPKVEYGRRGSQAVQ